MAEPPPPPPPPSNIDLCTILSESRRILKAHKHHFLTLQLLFLLPVSLSLSLYPYINHLFSTTTTITTTSSFLQQNPFIKPLIIFTLLIYTIIVSIFSNLATGSITHSVYRGYYGQPVTLSSSIKAAFTSFFPLLSTTLVRSFIMFGINLILALAMLALLKATQVLLSLQVFYSEPYFIFALTLVYVLVVLLIGFYLGVNWIFADVFVVVESSWGAEPLKRSRDLVKGTKRVALKLLILFGFISSINTLRLMITPSGESAYSDYKSISLVFVLNVVVTCFLYMVIMLYSLAANTVFYIYAKAQHEQIAEGFAGEYVSLPFDDDIGKVHRVASIV